VCGVVLAAVLGGFGSSRAESTTYDSLGRVISVITDDGQQTRYVYDAAGNRTSFTTSGTGVTKAPIAADDVLTYDYGSSLSPLTPLTNDSDPNGLTLSIVGIAPPQFGTATFNATTITYTPPTAYVGATDAFAYTIQNSAGVTASAMIKIALVGVPPVAKPDSQTAAENGPPITFDPRVNDSDPNGGTLTVTGVTTPMYGQSSYTSTSVTYTPPPSSSPYYGPDSFGYTIKNTAGLFASSTISITVTALPPPAAPVAVSTSINTAATFDPRVGVIDPNHLALTISAVGAPGVSGATAVINGGSSITYTPATNYTGADSFGFTLTNSGGGSGSSTVTVTISSGPLTSTVSPTAWSWYKAKSGQVTMSPSTITAVASGGTAPYTFAWTQVSGTGSITATAPSNATTQWSDSSIRPGGTDTAYWICTVTDANHNTAQSGQVTLTFTWDNGE